ncbi:unnamed protein product [Nippostrongylus brasiliensis]|uniref:Serpentine receptor class gamma n=1 Tax=Nippostrongylus brasiliensis TaxID=27835 RepID=A0A0N4XH01_NIPBR|nr:unnamed protein product [Nippostrongylus brasiliensis]
MPVAELSINVDCDYAQTLVFGSIEYTSMAIFCITLSLQVRLSIVLLVFVYSLPWVTTWFLIPAVAYYTPITDTASVVMTYIKIKIFTFPFRRDPLSLKRSERSLMLMTFSICVSLSINFALQFFFYYTIYVEALFFIKGFVNDMLLLLPTFTFYFTHPIFRTNTKFDHISTPVVTALVYATYCSITYRLPMTGLLTANLICEIKATAIITTIYALEFYLNYAAIYSSVAISLLRVAVVLHPSSSKKFQGRLCIVLLVIVYTLPWATMWFLVPVVANFTPVTVTASVWRNSLVLLIVTGFGCFMNVACFFVTITRWRTLASKRDPLLVRRSERSLMLMTFSICISLSINLLIQLLFYYAVYADVVFFIKGFVYDMLLLLPTFTFYFTHPIFSSKTNFEQHSTPVVTVQPSVN